MYSCVCFVLKELPRFSLMYYVYVATNPSKTPPYIKIGYSRDVHRRMQQLSNSDLEQWELVYKYGYNSENEVKCMENQLHRAFVESNCKNSRGCSSREMFFASPHHVNEVITTQCLRPKKQCCVSRYHCNCNGYGGIGRVSFEISDDIIKTKYEDWVNSNCNHNELKKHLAEFMEFMDEKVRVGTKISEGEYLKNSNILKKCYDTINLS